MFFYLMSLVWQGFLCPFHTYLIVTTRSIFLLACMFLGSLYSQNQGPEYLFTVIPESFQNGDTIAIEISVESEESISELRINYSCDGFTVDPASLLSIDLANSWLCPGGGCTTEIEFSNDGKSIDILISRVEGDTVTGYGVVAQAKGVIVVVEDMVFRKIPQAPLLVYPNPASNYVFINWGHQSFQSQLTILNEQGKKIHSYSDFKLPGRVKLGHFRPGIYYFIIKTDKLKKIYPVVVTR